MIAPAVPLWAVPALCLFTAIIVVVCGRFMLAKWPRPKPGYRANLIAVLVICLAVAGVMSFLVYSALADGVAYSMGRNVGVAYAEEIDPGGYWFAVVIEYVFGVIALSAGLAAAAKLMRAS